MLFIDGVIGAAPHLLLRFKLVRSPGEIPSKIELERGMRA
jgi:hypothetical protein